MTPLDAILCTIPHEKEYRFHSERKWRFDYAIPDLKIGIEYEGGVWQRGRHTRGKGFTNDCEKYNQAQIEGWVVLRYTSGNWHQLKEDLKKIGVKKI